MFEKQKIKLIASKIQKYAGGAVVASPAYDFEKDRWFVRVEVLEDEFVLDFKGVDVKFERKKDGNS